MWRQRVILGKFRRNIYSEIYPRSSFKSLKKEGREIENKIRENEIHVQMLSKSLHDQIFKKVKSDKTSKSEPEIDRWKEDLIRHGLKISETPKLPNVDLKLPKMKGNDIVQHFYEIAKEQTDDYKNLLSTLNCDTPPIPSTWETSPGWTRYGPDGAISVPFPNESALIFDVEVCVTASSGPVMATAVSPNYWYSWTSQSLQNLSSCLEGHKYQLNEMIPLESTPEDCGTNLGNQFKTPKIVVGHNVSYDRARVKEQYWLEHTGLRFIDTMSLHICVSGVTSYQRAMLKSTNDICEEDLNWSNQSSLNNLADVFKLYCDQTLNKESRNTFVVGTLNDINEDFQNLMNYCATDVKATHSVFKKVFSLFLDRFPHPATLAGMLEIGSAYLPVNSNWNNYINESNLAYEDLDIEAKYLLANRAEQTCQLMHDNNYEKDLWMWDQDWSTQQIKMKKAKAKSKKVPLPEPEEKRKDEDEEEDANKYKHLYETVNLMPAIRPLLPGYPAWYRKLYSKTDFCVNKIGTGMLIAPKLLALSWEGYPLHHIRGFGWGFLIPHKTCREEDESGQIPLKELVAKCPVLGIIPEASQNESEEALAYLWKDVEANISKIDYYKKPKKENSNNSYKGTGVWCNLNLENCCWFLKLPHKNGASNRVGNPLAKDFLNKFSENVLTGNGKTAGRIIEIAKMLSYWRNNRDRISNQMVVWLTEKDLPKSLASGKMSFGAIIPQVVVSGTLTRRATEPTWMTASNAQRERVGSELRGMVQAPEGFKIVGADVDSQELWIASLLGDAHAAGMHGATPFGWMTLSGTKATKTDMHSVTAKAVGISRDHAKVINYARIYGAGQNFAERLLKQFNPTLSDGEARSKAIKMFSLTKGKKLFYLKDEFKESFLDKGYTKYDAIKVAAIHNRNVLDIFKNPKWEGGIESAMFNRLEEIAGEQFPATPFLECRLSRALEPQFETEDRFLPTRINWVVQSGAVDFLHLMLVCMRWLMGPNVRFCLSFHDEVRYMVPNKYAYKAALAMHATNLLTRSFCASKVGLDDLPQSVAFFTSVEVDTVLRKESLMDCKTPSNPHGLSAGYEIPAGETLDIYEAIKKVGSNDLSKWDWHKTKRRK